MEGGHVDLFTLELTAQCVKISLKAPLVVVRRAAITLLNEKNKNMHKRILQNQIVIWSFHMKRISEKKKD